MALLRRAVDAVVEELNRTEFDAIREEWNELASTLFVRHEFLTAYLDSFEPGARLVVLTVRLNGQLVAGLPLVEERTHLLGVPLATLRAPANVHSNRFDLVCEPGSREKAVEALWTYLRERGGFDLLLLRDIPPEGHARMLLERAASDGCGVAMRESWSTPHIPLGGGFEGVKADLTARFRANLRRRQRKLGARGQVQFECAPVAAAADLSRALAEGFALEASGWKGRSGTAILRDPPAHRFYLRLASAFAPTGELRLFFLRLDGRPVAFFYCLESARTLYLPKLAYDEALADCSPGHLLTGEVVRDACTRGLADFDFLGPSMDWKLDWASHLRVHHTLWMFRRGSMGRTLSDLRFKLLPRLRSALLSRPASEPRGGAGAGEGQEGSDA
ncbi:MAG: GNAT family N-acetyltransferase [Deltaproteobacteria bacterium]|nr:GNAT family N-acetyltransferase [Deltaproteobacteria bacterium]